MPLSRINLLIYNTQIPSSPQKAISTKEVRSKVLGNEKRLERKKVNVEFAELYVVHMNAE